MTPIIVRSHKSSTIWDGSSLKPFLLGNRRGLLLDGWISENNRILALEAIFHRISTKGLKGLSGLNGEYCGVWFAGDRTIAFRDVMGTRPLYFFGGHNEWTIATSCQGIIDANPDFSFAPNMRQVHDYLHDHWTDPFAHLQETCFRDISVLPPGTAKTFSNEGATPIETFDELTALEVSTCPVECERGFRDIFSEAVRHRTEQIQSRAALSFSGGLDSSSIASVAPAETLRLYSYSSTDGDAADELAIQQRVAEATGHPWRAYTIAETLKDPTTWPLEVQASEAPFVDGLGVLSHRSMSLAREDGCRIWMTGHFGDEVFFVPEWVSDQLLAFQWIKSLNHLRNWKPYFDRDEYWILIRIVLREAAKKALPRRLENALRACLGKELGLRKEQRCYETALQLKLKSRYYHRCLEWNQKIARAHGLTWSFPMLDRRVFCFLLGAQRYLQKTCGTPRRLLRMALRQDLPEEVFYRRWKGDFSVPANELTAASLSQLSENVSPTEPVFQKGFLDYAQFSHKIKLWEAKHSKSECRDAWSIANGIAVNLWLKQFGEKL